jgi:hypothetical protein
MRFQRATAAVVAAAATIGCGGGTTDPTATEIRETVHVVAPREAVAAAQLSLAERGTVEVSADWTVAANNIDVYATPGDCFTTPSALSIESCLVLAQTVGIADKPERLSFPGLPGAVYRVFVVNRGSQPDTVTVRLTVR